MSMHRSALGARATFALAALLALAAGTIVAPDAAAQNRLSSGLPSPRVLVLAPAGGKAGSTVEVLCAGTHIENVERIVFSHAGLKGELLSEPMVPVKGPKGKGPKMRPGQPTPGLARIKVTIGADVPLGNHELRIVNKWGVSNPRTFVVGDLPEVNEKEPNNEDTQAQRVEINATINGAFSSPIDVDYYVFKGTKGQRVVVSCLASSIDSRAQPAIEIYDTKDRQLTSNVGYRGTDALTDVVLPADADYYVRVFQFTHTFRQPIFGGLPGGTFDYFYRLTITTAPWIDAIHPVVLEPGKATTVTIHGRNLPGGKRDPSAIVDDCVLEKATVTITAPSLADARKRAFTTYLPPSASTIDGFEYRLRNASGSSNAVLLALATAPVVLDNGANDTVETAQEINLPCEIAGVVEKRRDRDWYVFSAKKGEACNIEVFSNRLGAPTYMTITLRSAAAKTTNEIYSSPLNENMAAYTRQFYTRSEDPPVYRFVAPADGKYLLLVADRSADSHAGPRHTYRVRITRDQPSFHLVAMASDTNTPASATVFQGGNQALTVFAWRHDGFNGDITLSVEGLPPGVTCPPQTLAGSVRKTTLVLSGAPSAAAWTGEIKVKGTATAGGKAVVVEARSGSIVWPVPPQQNITTVSRLDRNLWLAVRGKAPYLLTANIDKATVFQGDKATIKVKLDRLWPEFKSPLTIQSMQTNINQGMELPVTLRINNAQPINLGPAQKEGALNVTIGPDVPPGDYNLVLHSQTIFPYNKDPKAKARQNTPVVQPSSAVKLTVLPKSLLTLTPAQLNTTVKSGAQVDVVVRVTRRFNFDGELKVSLVLPKGVKGVEAADVVIPAGQNEGKLVVRAPVGTAPGFRGNLIVRVVATFRGTPVPHEARLNVNVVK
jgi:hypothetical protein